MPDDADLHARLLATQHADPTAWFEWLYAEAAEGRAEVPWDREQPSAALVEWAQGRDLGEVRTLVVGCGLGRDAELLAASGADVLGFDISPSAIAGARARHAGSPVRYQVGDVLAPPPAWSRAFDLVVESMTVQALPDPVRSQAIAEIGQLVAPGGTLVVLAAACSDGDPAEDGPPWPLSRAEIDAFATGGLVLTSVEENVDPVQRFVRRWRAELTRPR